MAEFRESANPQFKNLVFDARLKVELQHEGHEGILRGTELLGDCGHDAQEKAEGLVVEITNGCGWSHKTGTNDTCHTTKQLDSRSKNHLKHSSESTPFSKTQERSRHKLTKPLCKLPELLDSSARRIGLVVSCV